MIFRNQPVWIAIRFKTKPQRREIDARLSKVFSLFNLRSGWKTHLSLSSDVMLFSATPKSTLFDIPLFYTDSTSHSVCSNYMPTMIKNANSGKYLRELLTQIVGDLPSIWSLPPPISYAHHNFYNNSIFCVNDFFGSGKIYNGSCKEYDIFSVSLACVAIFSNSFKEDRHAWEQYLAFDWLIDDRTFFEDIRLLPPGSRVTLNAKVARIMQTHDYAAVKAHGIEKIDADDAIQAGIEVMHGVSAVQGGALPRIGLSGGRDSRLVSAIAKHAGIDADYDTGYPPVLEAEIAEELVKKSDHITSWKKIEITSKLPPASLGNVIEKSKHWFSSVEGDCWPSSVMNETTIPNQDNIDTIINKSMNTQKWNLSGGGGEICKSHYYTIDDIDNPKMRLKKFFKQRLNYLPMLKMSTKENVNITLQSIFYQAHMEDISGLYAIDWFYVRSQQRRRVPTAFSIFSVFPLFTPHMMMYGFNTDLIEKIEGKAISNLTEKLAPEWSSVPYFGDVAHKYSQESTNKTMAKPYYWEINPDEYAHYIKQALNDAEGFVSDDALKIFQAIRRGDPLAAQVQNFSNRLFWRLGFKEYCKEIGDAKSKVADIIDELTISGCL